MTYKELLFKMADKGMLTLSTKSGVAQDDRGLFWAGMDNMDALNQPFNWEDFSHKYSKEDINGMRETLHESEWEGMKDRHLKKMLWDGCDGWESVTDSDVIEMYENIYGETDNVEIVQGEITAKFNDIK
jgi:predicted PolB exonuclease-like 3'-5' exonuclease